MAINIAWPTGVITVPRADMNLVQTNPFEVRELDLEAFREELRAAEDDAAGMPWPKTHNHNTTVTLSGTTYARVIEIINGYTVTFEDGSYAVNAIGANSNIADVLNLNAVQLRTQNSAGLIVTAGGGGGSTDLTAIELQLDQIEAKVDNVDTDVAAIDTKVTTVETKIDNVDADIAAVDTKVTTVETKVDTLQETADDALTLNEFIALKD